MVNKAQDVPVRSERKHPSFSELDKAIDVLFDLFIKYYLILTATALASVEPVPQYDLLGPYRIPWIDPTR